LRRLRRLILFIAIIGLIWFIYEDHIKSHPFYQSVTSNLNVMKENLDLPLALDKLKTGTHQVFDELNGVIGRIQNDQDNLETPAIEAPQLLEPTSHSFSIHNIEIGNTREEVINRFGEPKRSTLNEYGVHWETYHENYQNFFMVAYDHENKVAGLYTNQDLLSTKQHISIGSPKEQIITQFGEPLSSIQKGWVSYQLQNNGEYHLYNMDQSYVTIFFDKHEGNTVTAVQIISEGLEKQKENFYGDGNSKLKEGFEFQLFDLTNATRVEHGLHPLSWDDHVKLTARDHSADMAINQYFDHTNLKGESPFDRMEEDQISFRTAGENLAAGQISSIFAHEGLMNSIGHRENILQKDFESLGVGVAFDSNEKPYFTQNFVTR
jgi:uncharacterized protein YkwD